MKRAATSANVLTLPPVSSVELAVVKGRQTLVRHGIFFSVVNRHRRACYMQIDGEPILADECKCFIDWLAWTGAEKGPSFRLLRRMDCPIDEHKLAALKAQQEAV